MPVGAATTLPVIISRSGSFLGPVTLSVTANMVNSTGITAAPAAHIIRAGQTATSVITIARIGTFAGPVTNGAVANAPTGLTAAVATSPVVGNTASITIVTSPETVPGNYALTFSATGTGATTRSVPITVIVQPATTP